MDEIEKIHQQITELTKKAQKLAIKKKEPIIEDIKLKIKICGITATELGFSEKSNVGATMKTPVAIKYKQGENT